MDTRTEAILKALLWSTIIGSILLLILNPWLHLFMPWAFPIAWIVFIPLLSFFAIKEESIPKLTIAILTSLGGIIYGINQYPSYFFFSLIIILEIATGVLLAREIAKNPKRKKGGLRRKLQGPSF